MGVQYQIARSNYEFKPTQKGIEEVHIEENFRRHPIRKTKVPKNWVTKGWVKECRIGWIAE